MPRASFAALLRSPGPVLGTWAQIPHPEAVEILGSAGFVFAIVDLEHGHFGLERATEMLRACDATGLAALARARDLADVPRLLDAGAVAVVVPGVEGAEAARAAVAATRFAPRGTRGACPCTRAGGHWVRDWPAHEDGAEPGCVALVETAAGVANAEEIAAVEGLAAVMVGPFDLAVSLGHRGDWRRPEVMAGVSRVLDAAHANGVPAIVPVFDPNPPAARAQVEGWLARGVRVFALGTDKILLADAASRWASLLASPMSGDAAALGSDA